MTRSSVLRVCRAGDRAGAEALFHRAKGATRVAAPQAAAGARGPLANRRAPILALATVAALPSLACGPSTSALSGGADGPVPIAAPDTTLEDPGVEPRPAGERAGVDVHHYDLRIDLTDPASGTFRGDATLTLDRLAPGAWVPLDFAGLEIEQVTVNGDDARFVRDGSLLRIDTSGASPEGLEIRVRYGGAPLDGLFFGEDADLQPAIFADNWPNRARWWFPSSDHPADKATVRFTVRVPAGFAVVANGYELDRRDAGGVTTWVWETDEDAPIPPYTMVIGVARFERRGLGRSACGSAPVGVASGCADVSVWALSGDGDYGAERFSRAPDMLDFYTELVGPYPYEKLAHVESSTRFGGMENSSAIFYGRGGWEGRRMGEGVIAHETAHQWFGDAITPASWYHLWVSEGFASYFGPLYFESRDGVDAFRERMEGIARTAKTSDVIGQAIVDSTTNDLFELLNANNYQKGAWVLHMLRGLLGDDVFFEAVRDYYARHLHAAASTADVQGAFERASGRDLSEFFDQWVRSPGYPDFAITWRIDGDELVMDVRQRQPAAWPAFTAMVEIEVRRRGGTTFRLPVEIEGRSQTLRFGGMGDVVDLAFDPDGWILKDVEVTRAGER
ncbi:MAG: M1 family metallopeptidase [Gemmatimonadota bacterium]|nr:M1 family metallopeptidase [Gemmatimonadota bacterium]